MAQENNLTVEVHGGPDPVVVDNVQYVSFVNADTFGIPALISEERIKRDGLPVTVVYVNPDRCTSVKVTRHA